MNISIVKESGIELLMSLFRLNNHERMIHNDRGSSDFISDWVSKLRLSIPPNYRELLERFFGWKAFFGLRIVPYLFLEDSPSSSDLVGLIKRTSPERLLHMFLSSDFKEPDELGDMIIQSFGRNEKAALDFAFSNPTLTNLDRYEAIEMLKNQSETRDSFVELLEFGSENSLPSPDYDLSISYSQELLEENLREFGSSYLRFLLDLDAPNTSVEETKLLFSWSLGGSEITIEVPEKNSIISVVGTDRTRERSLTVEKQDAAGIMSTMAKRESIEILRKVLHSSHTLSSIVDLSGLHRHNAIEVLAGLSRRGLVIPETYEGELTFRSEIKLLDKTLDEIRRQIIG
ncbi:MAG TPA: hypothetical protein ENN47_08825 [Mesotoga infera]|uniref:Uncharacterized protein n=1 Tax=Mesotoga infera TaxID=1236046 RepID=A0A7C1H8C3_9BACT|nr:hypothetical protein [Mesotoga infera]